MGTFAALKLPLDLTRRRGAAIVAREVVENFPGTRNVLLDEQTSELRFDLHFPGNLSALVSQLHASLVPTGERAEISLPVRSLVPELVAGGASVVSERLEEGAEVWDVALERGRWVTHARVNGDRVEASIVPSSSSLHQIYDALLTLGLVASGAPYDAARDS